MSQHPTTAGHCKGFLSLCRQRKDQFSVGKYDSANPDLTGAAKGLQGRCDVRKRRKSSSAMPSVSRIVQALHPLHLPSSTSRHYSAHNPFSVANPSSVSNPGSAGGSKCVCSQCSSLQAEVCVPPVSPEGCRMRTLPTQPRAVLVPGAGLSCSRWQLMVLPQPAAEEELNLFHQYVGSGRGPGGSSSLSAPCVANPVPTPVTTARSFWTVSLAPTCPDDWS